MTMRPLRKSFESDIVDVTPGQREVVACISTAALDRDGEVVLPTGLEKKNYGGLTVFYDHDTCLPLGTTQWVKESRGRILAKYRLSDKTQFARDMFALAQDGVLKSYSIGFLPRQYSAPTTAELQQRPELQAARRIYRRWELLEFSLVGIAANPEATMLAISKKVSVETLAALQKNLHPAAVIASPGKMRPMATAEIASAIAAGIINCDLDALVNRTFDRIAGRVD